MSNLVIFFIGGIIAGLGTALPIGPTNFWIIRAALPPSRPVRNVAAFVTGLIFFDAFYAALAFWGYSAWFSNSAYASGTIVVGGIGLILLGAHGLWQTRAASRKDTSSDILSTAEALPQNHNSGANNPSTLSDLSIGFFLGSNPTFIAYWIVAVSTASGYAGGALRIEEMFAVFAGIIVGDLLWYASLFSLVRKYLRVISPVIVYWIQLVVAAAFFISGALILWKSLL